MAIYFHVDTNSAYLSWEAAYRIQHGDTLDLRDIPSVVGGDAKMRHGIVLAKSAPAKKYGIVTGETVHSARLKCPKLTAVPPNYELYMQASAALKGLLESYSPNVEQYSIDEMFLEYCGDDRDAAMKQAREISTRIKGELGFTVNVGVGENKLCAKMAGELEKPDKVISLWHDEISEKLWCLPVGRLMMVGPATRKKLISRGICTIGALAALDREYVYRWLKKPGVLIWEYANGIDASCIMEKAPVKSLSNSITMHFDVESCADCGRVLLAICEMLGMRLRRQKLTAGKISVSYKDSEFGCRHKEQKLAAETSCTNEIYSVAMKLFKSIWRGENIRQFGVGIGDLRSDNCVQMSMLGSNDAKKEKVNRCMDKIREKYGYKSIMYATFLHSGISPVMGGVVAESDYPMMKSML